jgi:hypothetical protein
VHMCSIAQVLRSAWSIAREFYRGRMGSPDGYAIARMRKIPSAMDPITN